MKLAQNVAAESIKAQAIKTDELKKQLQGEALRIKCKMKVWTRTEAFEWARGAKDLVFVKANEVLEANVAELRAKLKEADKVAAESIKAQASKAEELKKLFVKRMKERRITLWLRLRRKNVWPCKSL